MRHFHPSISGAPHDSLESVIIPEFIHKKITHYGVGLMVGQSRGTGDDSKVCSQLQ